MGLGVNSVVRVRLFGGTGVLLPDTIPHLDGTIWGEVQVSGATNDVLPGNGGAIVAAIPDASLDLAAPPLAVSTENLTGTVVRLLATAGGAQQSAEYDAKVLSAMSINGADKVVGRTLSNGAYWERPPSDVTVLPSR